MLSSREIIKMLKEAGWEHVAKQSGLKLRRG